MLPVPDSATGRAYGIRVTVQLGIEFRRADICRGGGSGQSVRAERSADWSAEIGIPVNSPMKGSSRDRSPFGKSSGRVHCVVVSKVRSS